MGHHFNDTGIRSVGIWGWQNFGIPWVSHTWESQGIDAMKHAADRLKAGPGWKRKQTVGGEICFF